MMKKCAGIISCLCLLLCFAAAAPAAFAEDGEIDLADKSWDAVIEEFLAGYNVQEGQVTIGYYNTVTGEEHYYDPDRYMVTGSMYKVPLTMVFAEKAAAGEIDLEKDTTGGYRYSELLRGAIVDSNNDYAGTLWSALGSYHEYRRVIAPYMGEDPDNVDAKYYENNFFTARQMLCCLKKLYEGSDVYQPVSDLMKEAEQDEYFCRHEDRYEVAHKYGYLVDGYILHLNDCGIIYTDDPYLLVCFTTGVEKPYGVVSNLCTLMSDYTQFHREERVQAEAEAEAERLRQEAERLRQEAEAAGVDPEAGTAAVTGTEMPAGTEPGREAGEPEEHQGRRAAVILILFALCAGLTVFAEVRSGSFDWKRLLLAVGCILAGLCFWLLFLSPAGG